MLDDESRPAIVTDVSGKVLMTNKAAERFSGVGSGLGMDEIVYRTFGTRARHLQRLKAQAMDRGSASDTIGLGARRLRLEVRKMTGNRLLWRFEQRSSAEGDQDEQDRVAIISVSTDGRIIGGNRLAKDLFGGLPTLLDDVTGGETFADGECLELAGASHSFSARLVELRSAEEWREMAVLPDLHLPAAPVDEILAGPGLLEALPVPMLKIAADGTLIEANHEARAILSGSDGGGGRGDPGGHPERRHRIEDA